MVKEEAIEMLILVPAWLREHAAAGPGPGEFLITAAAQRRPEPIHREVPDVWADRDADPAVSALYEPAVNPAMGQAMLSRVI